MKKYEFDNLNASFIIYDPNTGKSWDNHLWNDMGYHMTVSHTGLVNSRYVDSDGKQILLDAAGAGCLYLRDDDTGRYWNIGISPCCTVVSGYRCVHSMNFTSIESEFEGISCTISFTVSERGTYEIWKTDIKNNSGRERKLSLFSGIEFTLDGYKQKEYYLPQTTSETVFSDKCNALLCLSRSPFVPNNNCHGFVMCSEKVYRYEGNYEKFIGTAGNFASPRTVREGADCTNSLCTVRRRGGVLQNKIILKKDEKRTLYYIVGLCKGEKELEKDLAAMKAEWEGIFSTLRDKGIEKFGKLRTESPEKQINNIMNFWAQKQVSFCMIGKKAVRDNAQIAMAMLNFDTDLAKRTIIECAAHQYGDGHAILNWENDRDKNLIYSDTAMWLILSVCELIKETGDLSFLHMKLPYIDAEADTVYSHLKKAAEWYMNPDNIGKNGLEKIYYADWNDALNIPDKNAESVFMSMGVCLAFKELALLAEFAGDKEYSERLLKYREEMAEKINKAAYNGEYYIRAISKFGNIGDKDCENGGRIYVNPQTWAILSEVVPKDRLKSVLKSIDAMENENGIPLCMPPYQTYDEHVGRMSGMLPGLCENGGIYNHACGFKIMADCKLGRKEEAMGTLLKVIPDGANNPSARTTTEPYVFVNCYMQHKSVEMMVWFSWQTGTSAWILRDYYEGILGLKRTYDGLMIEPCIPSGWSRVYAERTFRGNLLKIEFINGGSETGISVDGKKIDGNVLPCFNDSLSHNVTVRF